MTLAMIFCAAAAVDERALRWWLPAASGYQNLSLGDLRCGEIQDEVVTVWISNTNCHRRRRNAAFGSSKGRHEHTLCNIDEVDGDNAVCTSYFRPMADAAQMARAAEANDCDAMFFCLL